MCLTHRQLTKPTSPNRPAAIAITHFSHYCVLFLLLLDFLLLLLQLLLRQLPHDQMFALFYRQLTFSSSIVANNLFICCLLLLQLLITSFWVVVVKLENQWCVACAHQSLTRRARTTVSETKFALATITTTTTIMPMHNSSDSNKQFALNFGCSVTVVFDFVFWVSLLIKQQFSVLLLLLLNLLTLFYGFSLCREYYATPG